MDQVILAEEYDGKPKELISLLSELEVNKSLDVWVDRTLVGSKWSNALEILSKFSKLRITISIEDKLKTEKDLYFLPEIKGLKELRLECIEGKVDWGFFQALRTIECFEVFEKIALTDLENMISSLPKLRRLWLSKQNEKILSNLPPKLQRLSLEQMNLSNLGDLKSLSLLKMLLLGESKDADLGVLKELEIESLGLWRISKLSDIKPISSLTSLKHVWLQGLPKVEKLPDLSRLIKLQLLTISELKQINDLSPLLKAKSLKELNVNNCKILKPENFSDLSNHPTLKTGNIDLGSDKKNDEIDSILPLKLGKSPFYLFELWGK